MSTVNTTVNDFPGTTVGAVIDRPTGELAVLWRLYAAALDRIERLRAEQARNRRTSRK